jgi:hypothetical protein
MFRPKPPTVGYGICQNLAIIYLTEKLPENFITNQKGSVSPTMDIPIVIGNRCQVRSSPQKILGLFDAMASPLRLALGPCFSIFYGFSMHGSSKDPGSL